MRPPVRISPPVTRRSGRVVAMVDGQRLWFESSDVELRTGGEAFGSAMWLPALAAGADLQLLVAADPVWKRNLARVAAIASDWWGYEERAAVTAGERAMAQPMPGRMLCFTGGVDSFHSLLTQPSPPDAIVYAAGFDIRLRDRARLEAVEASVRAVAAASRTRAILVRTNLRRHRTFRAAPWENAHGGALAALGHLVAGVYGTLITSSTHTRDDGRPWGSDWRLDPLWSATDLKVVHAGAEIPREEKLRQIAANPLVRAHLRVCWEHRNAHLNCGHCDKCLATMAILAGCEALEGFATFKGGGELPERLDRLPATKYLAMYPRVLGHGLPAPVERAVRKLLERSSMTAVAR